MIYHNLMFQLNVYFRLKEIIIKDLICAFFAEYMFQMFYMCSCTIFIYELHLLCNSVNNC